MKVQKLLSESMQTVHDECLGLLNTSFMKQFKNPANTSSLFFQKTPLQKLHF